MFTLVDGYSVKETRRAAKEEAVREMAKKMLDVDVPIDKVIAATGLTREEVERLRKAEPETSSPRLR